MICEARFAIFEIRKFFQVSLSYKSYVVGMAFQLKRICAFALQELVPKGRFFLTRHIQLQLFFVKDIADSVLILFAPERAKNLGPTHGALFSNFGPEVPQKNF